MQFILSWSGRLLFTFLNDGLIEAQLNEWSFIIFRLIFHLFMSLALEYPSNQQCTGMAEFCWQQGMFPEVRFKVSVDMLHYWNTFITTLLRHSLTVLHHLAAWILHSLKSVGLLRTMYILGNHLGMSWVVLVFDITQKPHGNKLKLWATFLNLEEEPKKKLWGGGSRQIKGWSARPRTSSRKV